VLSHAFDNIRATATDGVAWSVCLCLLVIFESPAAMDKPIEMPFGGWLEWA